MRILVADDHPMVRDALMRTLAALDGVTEVCAAVDHDDLLDQAGRGPFDLALVDLNMPGIEGLAGLRRLRDRHPRLALIVVSGQADAGIARAVLDAGAAGFVPKTGSADMLLEAVRQVRAGGVFVPPHALLAWNDGGPVDAAPQLTPRQRDVLALLQRGEPNRVIAQQLGLTEGTVKLHIAALLRALRARNRTEAVVRARALGLTEP